MYQAFLPMSVHLRTTTTLHHALILWHIAAEPLFLTLIPSPMLVERIQIKFHYLGQDVPLSFLLHALDQFVEDPGAGDKLCRVSQCVLLKREGQEINIPLDSPYA